MKVAIYGQTYNDDTVDYVCELLSELKLHNANISFEKDFYNFVTASKEIEDFSIFTENSGLDASFDMFVSFGGDGTILRAITFVKDLGIPIVGVNTGRLGFLSTFKKEDVKKVVQEFVAKDYTIVDRSLVAVTSNVNIPEFNAINFALNEVTVSRKDTTSMITVETSLNNEYLNSYWADGLIVSTPTGSTGYSLSCGGPVITPTAKSLVITPIAPHNLNARPLVISDNTVVKLKVSGREKNHLLSLDSRIVTLENGTEITVKKADFTVKLIEYTSESFLKTLRNKLLWGEDKRN
ncbi:MULTISPECIES: NAD kinase [Cellulophaga]|uniref:NAD kinase n=2 Tax=Cellulophaga TaxID=104264 RepID=F0RD64_CELLC|nr:MULTISPECIES: NAD kinase [Cellulophaga]ADY29765.1 inorganic polyphosphate/ATP-NAD kinase [Cellulophaga lytica DSM 7489]AIM60763.1 inorganic polyphosphate kinase [Cellulophaga lytica]APU10639.1 NAD kinase [Cellulophaga lytica]EWH15189.1 inorganic polyphosphate/ATP-NAD kinase [Cellulophaga geojensis KL-A]WQG76066.1 NAD kinase [Cellulophaga lytica]